MCVGADFEGVQHHVQDNVLWSYLQFYTLD